MREIRQIADAYFVVFAALLFVSSETLHGRGDERAAIAVGLIGIASGLASLGALIPRACALCAELIAWIRRDRRISSFELYPIGPDVSLEIGARSAINVGPIELGKFRLESVSSREISPGVWLIDARFRSAEPLRVIRTAAAPLGPDESLENLARSVGIRPAVSPDRG